MFPGVGVVLLVPCPPLLIGVVSLAVGSVVWGSLSPLWACL